MFLFLSQDIALNEFYILLKIYDINNTERIGNISNINFSLLSFYYKETKFYVITTPLFVVWMCAPM
jgi:hypothetical protein